jgi:hypothetical protein
MEAAAFGLLFLLAMFAPALFGGSPVLVGDPSAVPPIPAVADTTPWALVLALFGAGGLGALLQLGGRSLWEIGFPYGPASGWRRFKPRAKDFRVAIATSEAPYESLDYRNKALPLARQATGAEPQPPGALQRSPWPYRGHEYVLTEAFFFYRDAPESIVGWVTRRYQRFVDALSVAAAIVLGVVLGWVFLPGQDIVKQAGFSAILLAVAVFSLAWAAETRRLAQEMEAFWFAFTAKHVGDAATPVHVVLDPADRVE